MRFRAARHMAALMAASFLLHTFHAGTVSASPSVIDAGGQRQWISCTGEAGPPGSPTIVIVSGLGADHGMWRKVIGPMAQRTRVCITDRPGLGSSPPRRGSKRTNAGEHARELAAVLEASGERGPFILVGHSYGGLVVRAFSAAHPGSASGMLLLDAVWPGVHRDLAPGYASPWHEGGTSIDMAASARASADPTALQDLPLVVISAGDPDSVRTATGRLWNRRQAQVATLSDRGVLWFARRSGHRIQLDQPAIVLRAVDRLLAQAHAQTSSR